MPGFANIHGQPAAHDRIRGAVSRGRVPHAYLFHGGKGVGKTSTGFALAQFLNCESPGAVDSCGKCRSCRLIDRIEHPDVTWIFPMPGSEKGHRLKAEDRIDHMRDAIISRLEPGIHGLTYPGAASIAIGRDDDSRPGSVSDLRSKAGMGAVEAKFKVFVVSEAERMTREAANSLLKVLEEPPPNTILVLTTDRPGELLDTIMSRCHQVRFQDLNRDGLVALLQERSYRYHVEKGKRKGEWRHDPPPPEVASLASALGRGSLTRADSLADERLTTLRDRAIDFLNLVPGDLELHEMTSHLDEKLDWTPNKRSTAAENDRRVIELVIDLGLLWHGDLLRAATGASVPLVNQDREADIRRQAAVMTVSELRRRITVLEEARAALRGNVYRPLVLFPLILKLNGSGALATVS